MAHIKAQTVAIEVAMNDYEEEFGKVLLDEVQKTAPVDTGTYRDGWHLEENKGDMYLVNDVDYARYIVYPNRKMVNSPYADDPTRGILHNVRGIVYSKRTRFKAGVVARLRSIFG